MGVDADADRARGFRVTSRGVTLVTPEMLGQLDRGEGPVARPVAESLRARLQEPPDGGDDLATMVRLTV